jgi:hypothetical protein
MEVSSIITTIALISTNQNELFTALAKAQASYEVACFDSANPHFKSKFASYAELVAATRPALSANGLSVNHKTITELDGRQFMFTYLNHSSGQFTASLVPLRPDKKVDVQGFGSERSYQMRYSYKEIVGVCAHDGEDDDGEAAVGRPQQQGSIKNNDTWQDDTITKEQALTLTQLLSTYENGSVLEDCIKKYNCIDGLAQLTQSRYQQALAYIKKERKV